MTDTHSVPHELEARVEELLCAFNGNEACASYLLCDKHPKDKVSYRIVERNGQVKVVTFGQLKDRSEKLADGFQKLGLEPGDRVATLMNKGEDFLVSLLAIWRLGATHVPLFTAFAPGAIEMRLESSQAKFVICDHAQYPKLEGILGDTKVIMSDQAIEGSLELNQIEHSGETGFKPFVGGGDWPVIQIYTSGTTGKPKGVAVPMKALASFQGYGEFGLGVTEGDVFWNAADPGWGYGLYFGVIVALSTGVLSVMHTEKFSAESTYDVLVSQGVTNFTAAPTVYRTLRASNIKVPDIKLRSASSAGEPLTPDVNEWAPQALGTEVHDHFGQTESGMLVCNHHHPLLKKDIKAGSMGSPAPGWSVTVIDPDTHEQLPAKKPGLLAVELSKSPFAWFSGYVGAPEKNIERLTEDGKWYLTGDLAEYDEDGYFRFSSREDDVIIMAGYRIGPFDIEATLSKHPAVIEVAVIAVPDEIRGEVLEAAVVLAAGYEGSEELTKELQQKVKTEYAAYAYPRRIHYFDEFPKTPSGKIQRFVIRKTLREELEKQNAS